MTVISSPTITHRKPIAIGSTCEAADMLINTVLCSRIVQNAWQGINKIKLFNTDSSHGVQVVPILKNVRSWNF